MTGSHELWAGRPELALELTERYLNEVGFSPWVDDMHFLALQATGKYRDDPGVFDPNPEGSIYPFPRRLLIHALDNDIATARNTIEEFQKENLVDDLNLLLIEAALGNRETANALAGKLDSGFAGPFILTEAVKACFCGAPFDLEATPNFKARIEEAGFAWPPPTRINYPAKDW